MAGGAAGRITPLDLTLDQVDEIEAELGLPFQRWNEASRVKLARLMLQAAGEEIAGDLTVEQLLELVVTDTETDPAEDPGPE